MSRIRYRSWSAFALPALAVFLATATAPGTARAQVILTPTGVAPGSSFRIVFVTNTTTPATSTSISTYNNFVSTAAAGYTYDSAAVTWSAIGSTSSVNAITNIGTFGVPVYLNDGTTLVANSDGTAAGGLFSGSILNAINKDLGGTVISATVWTGTNPDGSTNPFPLANPFPPATAFGLSSSTTGAWIQSSSALSSNSNRLYGISGVLTAPAAVPEPSSLALGATVAVAGLAVTGWKRYRGRTG